VRARGDPGGGIAVPSILNDRNNAEPINKALAFDRLSVTLACGAGLRPCVMRSEAAMRFNMRV
jgi:hypothetical protein